MFRVSTSLRADMPTYIFHACVPLCLKLFRVYVRQFFMCLRAYNHSFLPSVIKQATKEIPSGKSKNMWVLRKKKVL